MMDLNGDLEFRWHRNGGLSAQCPVVDQDPLTETFWPATREIENNFVRGNCIQAPLYRENRHNAFYFVVDMLNVKPFFCN